MPVSFALSNAEKQCIVGLIAKHRLAGRSILRSRKRCCCARTR